MSASAPLSGIVTYSACAPDPYAEDAVADGELAHARPDLLDLTRKLEAEDSSASVGGGPSRSG